MKKNNLLFSRVKIAGVLAGIALMILSFSAMAQLPAFPGAEGFAKFTTGGRGGMVVAVTNTQDTGVGSFRWAIAQYPGKPLTVVFRVSGLIMLNSSVSVKRSNLTIAGQTAPGDGICFGGNSVQVNGGGLGGPYGNIIIRHLRFRPGTPVFLGATGLNLENMHDVIVDHCSFSWANEENAAIYDCKNITIQWCISSEGLYSAWHHKGSRSYSGVWGGQYSSFHHNLIAHNNSRTIRYDGSRAHDTMALIDSRNNVIYNSSSSGSCYGGEIEIPGGISQINLVNTYYKNGPATPTSWKFVNASTGTLGAGSWYLAGNIMTGNASFTANNKSGIDGGIPAANKSDTAFTIPTWAKLTMQSADSAYLLVLAEAGAKLPKRDTVDRRIVNETLTGTFSGNGSYNANIPAGVPTSAYPGYSKSIGKGIIDTITAVGGWPVYTSTAAPADNDNDGMADSWELCRGLNPNDSADRNFISNTGYTYLEDYLNGYLCTTGISLTSNPGNKIKLFPNPAQSNLTITFPATAKNAVVSIISAATGQVVRTYTVKTGATQLEADTEKLPAGVYAVLYSQDVEKISETFIKQ